MVNYSTLFTSLIGEVDEDGNFSLLNALSYVGTGANVLLLRRHELRNVYMLIEKKDKRAAWLFKFVSFAIVP